MSLQERITSTLDSGLDIATEALKFVDSAAGVFPPLKAATGSALLIAQTVQVIDYLLYRPRRLIGPAISVL